MSKTVHHLGLDVHKETIAVAIAPEGGGTLEAVDKLLKKLATENAELRVACQRLELIIETNCLGTAVKIETTK